MYNVSLKKINSFITESESWKNYRDPTRLIYEYNKHTDNIDLKNDWRNDLKRLYTRLETERSISYRPGAVTAITPLHSTPDIIVTNMSKPGGNLSNRASNLRLDLSKLSSTGYTSKKSSNKSSPNLSYKIK